jgi:hypothetical protein
MKSQRKSGRLAKDKSNFAWARRHGLAPYGKFRRLLLPELKRVPASQHNSLLEKIYELAARKIRIEEDKKRQQELKGQIRPERLKLVQIRQHLQNAKKELSAADEIFPGDIWPWSQFSEPIDELELRIANIKTFEILCAGIIHPKLRSPAEIKSADFSAENYPNFYMRLIKKDSEIDFGFISALEQCLPNVAVRGGAVDVERTKIISQVFMAALGKAYNFERVKSVRTRLQKKPLASNLFLPSQTP